MTGLPADWQGELTQRGFGPKEVEALVRRAYGGSSGKVYPSASDTFRAFALCPLDRIRVVILGQDPYYAHPGQAHGLAFSVPELNPPVARAVQFPPSLDAVLRNLTRTATSDSTFRFAPPGQSDLSPWAAQGVLLVNTALTVLAGFPDSHAQIWGGFTDAVIDTSNSRQQPVAFMLWGQKAQEYTLRVRQPHRTFLMPHPAYRPGKGQTNVWRSGQAMPFLDVNAFLTADGDAPVDWSLD